MIIIYLSNFNLRPALVVQLTSHVRRNTTTNANNNKHGVIHGDVHVFLTWHTLVTAALH